MKLVFLILAHKNPDQLQKLTDYLLENGAAVFIHIDKKSKELFADFKKKNIARENLFIYSEYKVYWGGYNQIRATFFLLEEAINKVAFDFVSLLSGQDIPIKPLKDFSEFLEERKSLSFMEHHPLPCHWAGNGGYDRTRLLWFIQNSKPVSSVLNKAMVILHFFQNKTGLFNKISIELFGGANWFTLNYEVAEFATRFIKENSKFYKSFRFTRCADEIILQTILLNSQFKNQIENKNLRFIDWQSGPEYPKTFRIGDIDRLLENESFFARKFDEETDGEIINEVYNRLK